RAGGTILGTREAWSDRRPFGPRPPGRPRPRGPPRWEFPGRFLPPGGGVFGAIGRTDQLAGREAGDRREHRGPVARLGRLVGAWIVGRVIVAVHEVALPADFELPEGFVVELESRIQNAHEDALAVEPHRVHLRHVK